MHRIVIVYAGIVAVALLLTPQIMREKEKGTFHHAHATRITYVQPTLSPTPTDQIYNETEVEIGEIVFNAKRPWSLHVVQNCEPGPDRGHSYVSLTNETYDIYEYSYDKWYYGLSGPQNLEISNPCMATATITYR